MATSKAKKASAAKRTTKKKSEPEPLVTQQPQSNQVAAAQNGVFLHTDDAWSLAYFNPKDLHHLERELFGKA